MMAEHIVVKDPDSVIDYTLYWHEWLNGDTISTSTWLIVDSGAESPVSLTVDSDSIGTYTGQSPSLPTAQTTVIVSSGTAGLTYTLTNRITTAGGLTGDDSIKVRVWDK